VHGHAPDEDTLPTIAGGLVADQQNLPGTDSNASDSFAGSLHEPGRGPTARCLSLARVRSIHAATENALESLPDSSAAGTDKEDISYTTLPLHAKHSGKVEEDRGRHDWGVLAKNSHVLNQALLARPRRAEQKRPAFLDHGVAASVDIRPV
jgi:hypothetical protein